MKEIRFDGVDVKDNLLAEIIGKGKDNASKISSVGILFETTNQLKINSHHKFQITYGDKKAILSARVRDVLWKCTIEENQKTHTLYQVTVEFEHLKDKEKDFLETIIEQILDDTIPVPHDGVRGAKFHIKE